MYIYSFYQLFFCISYISYHPNMLKIMFLVLHITFFISLSVLLCILLYPHFLPLTVCITVLRDIAVGAPVFLTKNGRGRYAILDMQNFEKTQTTIRLMNELAKGRSENLSLTGLVLTVYHSLVHYF
mgnify:FL=1